MNAIQYDAAAIGNHEFNYGLATLDRAVHEAAFPLPRHEHLQGRRPPALPRTGRVDAPRHQDRHRRRWRRRGRWCGDRDPVVRSPRHPRHRVPEVVDRGAADARDAIASVMILVNPLGTRRAVQLRYRQHRRAERKRRGAIGPRGARNRPHRLRPLAQRDGRHRHRHDAAHAAQELGDERRDCASHAAAPRRTMARRGAARSIVPSSSTPSSRESEVLAVTQEGIARDTAVRQHADRHHARRMARRLGARRRDAVDRLHSRGRTQGDWCAARQHGGLFPGCIARRRTDHVGAHRGALSVRQHAARHQDLRWATAGAPPRAERAVLPRRRQRTRGHRPQACPAYQLRHRQPASITRSISRSRSESESTALVRRKARRPVGYVHHGAQQLPPVGRRRGCHAARRPRGL